MLLLFVILLLSVLSVTIMRMCCNRNIDIIDNCVYCSYDFVLLLVLIWLVSLCYYYYYCYDIIDM